MGSSSSAPPPDRRPDVAWRRASASIPDGYCVEVLLQPDRVNIRDSKGSPAARLGFDRREWASFLDRLDHRA